MSDQSESPAMNLSAIILCGGGSRRMGCEKASLAFGDEAMLARVVRLVCEVIPLERIVCVAAKTQSLPELPAGVKVVRDRQPDCGPLEGLATGLAAVSEFAECAFVTTCDAPLLVPEFVTKLASVVREHDAVVPKINGQWYPLSAVYRTSVLEAADERLRNNQRRVIDFVEAINARAVGREEFSEVDPNLLSVRNCNTMEEYQKLLAADER